MRRESLRQMVSSHKEREIIGMNNKLRRNIKLDYLNIFITNLNMQSSIWVLYLTYCNMSLLQIGLLEGIYHATSILCEIPSGALADLVGRKKSMIMSRICIAVSCMIMLFLRSFWWFALSFIIQAIGNNFNSGSEEALVYDSMKCLGEEDRYIQINGRLNMVLEVSQAIATVAGGVLAEYSYFWCYGACLVIALLALVPVWFMTEPPILESLAGCENGEPPVLESLAGCENEERTEGSVEGDRTSDGVTDIIAGHFRRSFQILRGDARILRIITYYSMIFASYTLLFFYSQQYYYDLGYNKIQISVIMLFAGIASCMGALVSDRMFHRLGERVAGLSGVLIAGTLVCYYFEKPMVSAGIFMAASFFNAVLYPVESELLNRLIPSGQRATLISVNSMFFSIMMIISFPVAGALADRWNLPCILGGLGVVLLLFILMWNQVAKDEKPDAGK